MATESFEITRIIRTSPDRVYRAWLDSAEHSAMTNTKCQIEPRVSGAFEVGDGYARGATVALEPDRRIVQTWKASDFPETAMDSRIELLLERTYGGTRLTLRHSDLPEGSSERYREGWNQFYFKPMDEYFDSQEGEEGRRHLESNAPAEGEGGVTVGDESPLHATISEFAQAHGNEVRPDVVTAPAKRAAPRKGAAKKPARAAAKKPAAKKAAGRKPAAKKPATKRPVPKRPTTKRKLAGNKAAKAGKAGKAGKAKPAGGKKKAAAKKRR